MKFDRGFAVACDKSSGGAGVGVGSALILAFAHVVGVNAPTVADFGLPVQLVKFLHIS